jgi:UDP-N-acetylmuramoyl-tripeptide--D-alanyl-D-alanine ligase
MVDVINSKKLAEITNGKSVGDFDVSGFVIDTRNIKDGQMFISLQGENVDGHQFAKQAQEKNAYPMVSKDGYIDNNYLYVDDCLEALNKIAAYKRAKSQALFCAVTGSVGKTSTKEMLNIAFNAQGNAYCSKGNFNNHIGTPLMLANIPADCEYGIFELGMNNPGEIEPLSKLVKPAIAIITNIEKVHLQNFNSLDAIADAKSEIFKGLMSNGYVILNSDNQYYNYLSDKAKLDDIKNIVSFGKNDQANCRLLDYKNVGNISHIKAKIFEHEIEYSLKIAGEHQAINSLAVIAAIYVSGGDVVKSAKSLAEFAGGSGRGEIFEISHNNKTYILIDDSYNAGPASMLASLKVLDAKKSIGRKIAILADMRELGENAAELHAELSLYINNSSINMVITVGELMYNLHHNLDPSKKGIHFNDYKQALDVIEQMIHHNDMILIKGSNGTKIHQIAQKLASKEEGKIINAL